MRKFLIVAALAGMLLPAACSDLTVPDYNNPSLEDLANNPTVGKINAAATGLLEGARLNISSGNGYVSLLGILGRESYNFDTADPRFITELLVGPLNAGSPAFGGNLWNLPYRDIRSANVLLRAVDKVSGLSDAQKEGVRGYAKTLQALEYLQIINTRDTNGAAIEVDRAVNDEPAPLATKAATYTHITQLLNEAQAHLQNAGASFSFPLPSGFAAFNTPATFLTFNRALKARVDVYTRDYPAALQALGQSFLDVSKPLTLGAYYDFGTGSGELSNGLFDPGANPKIRAHPSVVENAQRRANGDVDLRVQNKIRVVDSRTVQGVTSQYAFTIYDSPSAPIPIIRNENLILLRAEARWFTGNKQGAIDDLNYIRVNSGGLEPIGIPASDSAFVDVLLRERFYSLLLEGGYRWIDARRFGRLDQLPRDLSTHTIQSAFPIPEAECLARQKGTNCSANS